MDIYSFVNSKDIREHLKKLDYQFNSLEAAWLISRCKRLSYPEKKAYWTELIATMPDCEIPEKKRSCFIGWPSLHDALRKIIEITDRQIAELYREYPAGMYVYTHEYYYKGDQGWCDSNGIFPRCRAALMTTPATPQTTTNTMWSPPAVCIASGWMTPATR